MPKLARIRIPALADLVEQLRYAPAPAFRRHIESAAALALELDRSITYPEDWVTFRLTGFRPSMDNPALIVGEALLADLSAIIEHLTEYSECTSADVPRPAVGYRELGERWSVSRRTIDRYRRRGLIAYRVRDAPGVTRLLFPMRWVERFEERDASLIRKATAFSQVPASESTSIIEAARSTLRDTQMPLTRLAEHLAPRFDRSSETIRQVIIRHDESSESPLFHRDGTLDGEQRADIARAFEEGEAIAAICSRFGRSRATIYRIVNERRAEVLRGISLPIGPVPDSRALDILQHDVVQHGLDAIPDPDTETLLAAIAAAQPIPASDEHRRALAARVLRRRAGSIVAGLPRYDPPSEALDRAESDVRWSILLQTVLLRTQQPLILKTLKQRLGRNLLEFPPPRIRELFNICMHAAGDALIGYDPGRGGRLAAPVSLALNRVLAGLNPDDAEVPARRTAASSVRLDDWRPILSPAHAYLFPLEHCRATRETLPPDTARVLSLRFGWYGGPPLTGIETAAILEMIPRRVRTIQRRAMRG